MPYIVQFYKERKITKYCSTHLLSGKMLFVTFNFLTAMKSFLMPLYSTLLIAVTSLTLMYEVLHKQTNHGRWEPTRSIRERTTESLKPLTSPRASPSHTHRFLSASTQSSDLTLVRPLLTTLTKHSTLPLCRTPFYPPSFFPYHLSPADKTLHILFTAPCLSSALRTEFTWAGVRVCFVHTSVTGI